MGDKSPKSIKKHASQKQTETAKSNQRRQEVVLAKQSKKA